MMDADAVVNAQRQVDLSRLPLYHANHKKDVFTAEEWVERVQRAKDAGTWNDAATTSYVYNALREGALTWYRTLKWSNVDNQVWAEVKTAFLEAYGTTHTSRTTATAINDLKQGTDSVIDYYTKVVEVMSDLQALMPPDGLGRPDVLFSPEIRALAGYVGLAADNKTGAADTLIQFGAQRMIYFVATQIFINGLKPEIRTEVMKANPVTIMRACNEAQTIEKISATKKQTTTTNGTHISSLDENPDNSPEELQLQIDELQRRKQWATRRTGNSGQSGSPGYPGQSGSYGNRTGGGVTIGNLIRPKAKCAITARKSIISRKTAELDWPQGLLWYLHQTELVKQNLQERIRTFGIATLFNRSNTEWTASTPI